MNNVELFSDLTTMTADVALAQLFNVVKASVVAKRWGKNRALLYYVIDHKTGTGIPYSLSDADRKLLQTIINDLGMALMSVRFREGTQYEDVSPLCWGEDWASKFRVFGKTFKLAFFIQDCLGVNNRWQENRLSCKTGPMYNRIPLDAIDKVNELISRVARWMSNLEIVEEEQSKPNC